MNNEQKEKIKNVIVVILTVVVVLIVGYIVIKTQQQAFIEYCFNNPINCSNITALA